MFSKSALAKLQDIPEKKSHQTKIFPLPSGTGLETRCGKWLQLPCPVQEGRLAGLPFYMKADLSFPLTTPEARKLAAL